MGVICGEMYKTLLKAVHMTWFNYYGENARHLGKGGEKQKIKCDAAGELRLNTVLHRHTQTRFEEEYLCAERRCQNGTSLFSQLALFSGDIFAAVAHT